VAYLASHQVPLETCPLSNQCLGIYPNLAEHPLPRLYAAGVPLTGNSDDPPLFNATLNQNVSVLHEPFHFGLDTIDEILLNGVRHSFLPQEQKAAMEASFRSEMAQLRRKYHLEN
jgi:aminodeoxyfutalosine deaminase